MQTLEIPINLFDEWVDNPFKRSQVSDLELAESIQKEGLKQPLAVIRRGECYLVVDGNRRLRIAKRLGLTTLPAVIHSGDDPTKLAIILNTTGRSWDQQTLGQLIASHPEALPTVPRRFSGKLKACMDLLGPDFARFIREYTTNAFDEAMRAAAYLGRRGNLEFCKRAAFWVGKHKMTRLIRNAVEGGFSPAEIEKAILNDVPLKMQIVADTPNGSEG